MNYKIETLPRFDKDIKKLKKSFPKIKDDLTLLIGELSQNPNIGTHLEDSIYKIRLQNSSIPTGKSGGFRVITYYVRDEVLYLVTMYSKSNTDTIINSKLKEIIKSELL